MMAHSMFFVCTLIAGSAIIVFGLFSLFIKEKIYLTEAFVSTIFGFVLGKLPWSPASGQNAQDSGFQTEVISYFSRIIVGFQVLAVGVTLPCEFYRKHRQSVFTMTVLVTAGMFVISTLIVKMFFPGFPAYFAAIVGMIVTPTDPVVCSGITKGKFATRYIPVDMRKLILTESALNDGLCYPLLIIPLKYLAEKQKSINFSPAKTLIKLLSFSVFYEVVFSILLGSGIGYCAKVLLIWSKNKKLIDKESFLAYTLALGMFTIGLVGLLHSDDILAVFFAGFFFGKDGRFIEQISETHLFEVIDLLFNISFFIVFGYTSSSVAFNFRYFALAVVLNVARRMPCVFLLQKYIPLVKKLKEKLFLGWFGPIGVSSIFMAVTAVQISNENNILKEHEMSQKIMKIVTHVVLVSVALNGLTLPIIHVHMKKKSAKRKKHTDQFTSYTDEETTDAERTSSTNVTHLTYVRSLFSQKESRS